MPKMLCCAEREIIWQVGLFISSSARYQRVPVVLTVSQQPKPLVKSAVKGRLSAGQRKTSVTTVSYAVPTVLVAPTMTVWRPAVVKEVVSTLPVVFWSTPSTVQLKVLTVPVAV